MLIRIMLIICLLLFVGSINAQEREMIIHGRISDAATGETLEGAAIYSESASKGTSSNHKGEYRLSLTPGRHTVTISYVGYTSLKEELTVEKNAKKDFRLSGNVELSEIVVTSSSTYDKVRAPQLGNDKLSSLEIKRLPAMLGEVDVIKAIQLLPGVQSTSDGGSGFSVRGSAPDQNLILFDNSTIYNASHLLGVFSVFNNDVISGIDLYKGDIPVKYGGRLASLLDIRTKNNMPERFSMTGGLGLISSRLTIESPLGSKTSILLGGRRSYADLFLKMTDEYKNNSLYFYDLNGKIIHRFSSKDRLELSAYLGKDMFKAETQEFNYKNTALSAIYSHNFSSDFYSKLSVNYAAYDYGIYSGMQNYEMSLDAAITDYSVNADFSNYLSDLWNINYGASATFHRFKPELVRQPNINDYKVDNNSALEYSLYISNEQKFSEKFTLKYGVRFTSFSNIGKGISYCYDDNYEVTDSVMYKKGDIYNTYYAWEPRIAFVWRTGKNSSVKGSLVHNEQFIQLANNSAAGSPMDIWFSAGRNIKPQKTDMVSAGYFRNFGNDMYETSAEVYYKYMTNVIDFADHSNLMLNKYLDAEVRTGTGRAYGLEVMVKKTRGMLTGFMNYTISRSERTIAEINNGKTYLAPFDKTHCFNIAANLELTPKHMLSATWVYATGMPTTYPVGRFEINGQYFPIYSDRNEYRKPDYQRLDLSYTFTPKPDSGKRYKGEWVFSVFNAYARKNPWTISYDQKDGGTPYAEMVYLFGVLPSVTYNFKF